jgi:hypothetical protein
MNDFLTKASTKGFRTLLMAMRVLTKKEVDDFMSICAKAESKLETREVEL